MIAAAAAGQSLSCPKSFLGYRTLRRRSSSSSSSRSFTCAVAAAAAARVRNSNSDSDSGSDSSSSSSSSPSPVTLYDVLGVPAFAAAREIKAAYRRLARERHPDVAAEQNGGGSAEEFIRIHAAYATLSDPNKRAEYDRDVMRQRAGGCRPVFSYGGPSQAPTHGRMPRRLWETDQCW